MTDEGIFIEIQSRPEDYPYRYTDFEEVAIALRYIALEESNEDAA